MVGHRRPPSIFGAGTFPVKCLFGWLSWSRLFTKSARQSRLWIALWITLLHTVDKERGHCRFIAWSEATSPAILPRATAGCTIVFGLGPATCSCSSCHASPGLGRTCPQRCAPHERVTIGTMLNSSGPAPHTLAPSPRCQGTVCLLAIPSPCFVGPCPPLGGRWLDDWTAGFPACLVWRVLCR